MSINIETANSPPTWPATGGVALDGSDLHVLRLCLDLQQDALLLTVGAAPSQSQGSEPSWPVLAATAPGRSADGAAAVPSSLPTPLQPPV
jgi:hypothetical protein